MADYREFCEEFKTKTKDLNDATKVLILHTGGTIGLSRGKENKLEHTLQKNHFAIEIAKLPSLNIRVKKDTDPAEYNILPKVGGNADQIIYVVFEGEDILDSSDVTFDTWVELAKQVEIGYDVFDGFVITHGTNTMAYTASVLSFMLENLAKPVVLTGSQVPCFEPISDGPHNLAGAIFMAGASNINGVNLFFDGKLFHGNRARKNSAIHWDGFESPNLEPLCTLQNFPAGSNDTQKKIINPSLVVETRLCRNVSVIFFTPVLSLDSFSKSLSLPTEGAVLACYGANSLPMGRRDLMEELASASKRGVLLVAISQCHRTCSTKMSSANPDLRSNGIIPGADMTVEAAVAKLSYVLGKANLDLEGKKKMMEVNLAGELTPIDPTQ